MNKILGAIIGVTLAIIVLGSVVVSSVNEYTTEKYTYYNEGIPYAVPDDDSHEIVVSYDGADYIVTVDGTVSEVPDLTDGAVLIACEKINLVLSSSGAINGNGANSAGVVSGYSLGTVDENTTITLSISGDEVTSGSYTFNNILAFICPAGDYVYCSNPSINYNESGLIFAISKFTISGSIVAYVSAYGTAESMTGTVHRGAVTLDSIEVNTTDVTGGLATVDEIVFNFIYNGVEYPRSSTYLIVPAEVVYDNVLYLGSVNAGLISILPLILVCAVVVSFAYVFMRRD